VGIASVMIDSREPAWCQRLTFGDAPVAVTLLDAGDFLVACEDGAVLGIERKTAGDFLNTLRDDRLFPQLVRLREVTPWAYLALCGTLSPGAGGKCHQAGIETGWTWASVSGAFLSVQEMGVHILHIASDHDLEAAIIRLASRDRAQARVHPARMAAFVSEAEAILTALPGIGPEKAQALLAYCGSAGMALQYLTDDDFEGPTAPGVGAGTKRRIRKALELPDWGILGLVTKDGGQLAKHKEEGETVA